MPRLERFGYIFLVSGLAFFAFSFVVQGLSAWWLLRGIPIKTVAEISQDITPEFYQLAEDYPEEFKRYLGEPNPTAFAQALRLGRDIYIAEGCWHCHSQYVRPVANESVRFGPVSVASEYMNELNLPHLFGTRRVGPDLIREAGKHSNDWHVAHFYNPNWVVPTSVMPRFTWFFDKNDRPNLKGLAIVTYVQWLGSWARTVPESIYNLEVIRGE
ncbi:MAG: cbb3-type cytochrome c oxidase subunit II [Thermodesulfobacteriota bacterium]